MLSGCGPTCTRWRVKETRGECIGRKSHMLDGPNGKRITRSIKAQVVDQILAVQVLFNGSKYNCNSLMINEISSIDTSS